MGRQLVRCQELESGELGTIVDSQEVKVGDFDSWKFGGGSAASFRWELESFRDCDKGVEMER